MEIIDISIYKNRWSEITKSDLLYPLKPRFNEYFGYTDGYPVNEPIYERQMFFSDEMTIIDDSRLGYLHKIFDLTEENGIEVNDELYIKAEAFALNRGGRSARTAGQFINNILTINL